MSFYEVTSTDVILRVRVSPGSSLNKAEANGDHLKVKLTTPPIDGKANKHLQKFIAKLFRVAPSRVLIEKGSHGKVKTLRILDTTELPDALRDA